MKYIITLLLFTISSISSADVLDSDTVKRYQKQNPALFAEYVRAYELLNSWRGERQKLSLANDVLDNIIKKDDMFAPAYREFGRLLIMKSSGSKKTDQAGVLASAEAAIKHSIRLAPDYADAYVLLAHLYTKQRKFSHVKQALHTAEKLGTTSPWLDASWADYYEKIGNKTMAIPHYLAVIDSDTKNIKARSSSMTGLANIYLNQGNLAKARKLYDDKLLLESDSAWAWGNYASRLLFNFGDIDAAITKAEKALSLMNYGHARRTLSIAYCTKWATSDAVQDEGSVQLLENALYLLPDVNYLIEFSGKYSNTRPCAEQLRRYAAAFE